MLESFNLNKELEYQKLSPEEQSSRGILGRLKGVIADFKNPTRNGRKYTEELWEKTFSNPIMKEKIENRCLFGELGHPADRQEVDMEKIAICMAETPKKGSDGKLHAVFDILATPCGKILKTLCDYGCNIGVSSRGSGDTYTDSFGEEVVDADTFECECWDAVLIPAVKEARLQYVTESLHTNKTLKQALQESLDDATAEDKQIMKDKLDELNIDYSPEKVDNISEVEESNEADNDGTSLVQELQEALKKNRELENKLTSLQEKLSVSYTKEANLRDDVARYRNAIKNLTESSNRVKVLEQKISVLSDEVKSRDLTIQKQQETIGRLNENRKTFSQKSKMLTESASAKDSKIKALERQVKSLNESITTINAQNEKARETLEENIEDLKKDSAIKHSEYSKKLTRANSLVERYKKVANESVKRYIESQAKRIGVTPTEIRNRLSEGFSFDEVDRVCEELQTYRLNISKLPFDISSRSGVRMKVTESKEPIKPANRFSDEIDDQLKSLAGLN
jgi:uncharacterized coiled-coil DUF342 family protein